MELLKFKRYEQKYLIDEAQLQKLKKLMEVFVEADKHGRSTVCNLYFDTPSHLLIRRSLEKPVYKEKLRLRCYGTPNADSTSFVELKKKFQSVVFKRRIKLKYDEATRFLAEGVCKKDNQITNEIIYFLQYYKNLQPSVALFYDREAYFGRLDNDLRITFDSNILFRTTDLQLTKGAFGERILEEGMYLLEVKTSKAMPLWLSEFLNKEQIFKQSFSKYGRAYENIIQRKR